tara:strand:+ start:306 stop:419 length:114 start_codon:yes stop_codon:yes gene_type:complete
MSDIQDFENWVQDLETKEQPEAPSCGLNGSECDSCGS